MASKRSKMSKRQKEEILGTLLMALGALVLISLLSHSNQDDPSALQILRVHNAMGIAGGYISYWLIKILFGYPAILIPFVIIAWGWNRFKGLPVDPLARYTGYALFIAIYCATVLGMPEALAAAEAETARYSVSGVVGGVLAEKLYQAFGAIGSVIVLLAVGIVSALAMLRVSVNESLAKVRSSIPQLLAPLRERVDALFSFRFERPNRQHFERDEEPLVDVPVAAEAEADVNEPIWKRISRLENDRRATAHPAMPQVSAPHDNIVEDWQQPDSDLEGLAIKQAPAPELESSNLQPTASDSVRPDRYKYPPAELLAVPEEPEHVQTRDELLNNARILEERLEEFDIQGKVVEINPGPVITRYEYSPDRGIKVAKITALSDDLALSMRAKRIRVVAPIPGKAAVGIELPNPHPQTVFLRKLLESEEYKKSTSPLTIALGQTISGYVYVTSLEKMPHLLIAGATGAGKSVCLNAIILSILYKAHPRDVQFVMVDPKRLELSNYRMLRKHHLSYREDLNEEVVTNAPNALAVLKSLEWEMENRYTVLARAGMRNIAEYNARVQEGNLPLAEPGSDTDGSFKTLPYIVLIIDELADLMLTAAKEVEEPIARLTQLARAVGIHLIVATQRPSVDVITGVIKANFPSRIAFQVASKIDSRTILDGNGAEKLLGSGDMLFLPAVSPEMVRIHGAYISSEDIERVIEHVRNQPFYEKSLLPIRTEAQEEDAFGFIGDGKRDELFHEALKLVVRHQQGSISLLQRRLKIGYSRAARLIDELEGAGVVGGFDGSKARMVLVDEKYLEEMGLT